MRKEIERLETKRLLVTLAKIFLATDALALICLGCDWMFLSQWENMGFFLRVVSLGATIVFAIAGFVAVANALRLREMRDVLDVVNRKLSRRRKA
jgi:peptidoglycan biosynthesis protein MviN/MurJ (putative lipid II flippase)